jgi:hypothetical protein
VNTVTLVMHKWMWLAHYAVVLSLWALAKLNGGTKLTIKGTDHIGGYIPYGGFA